MTLLPPGVKVHLAFGYIDMRKGIDGLPPRPLNREVFLGNPEPSGKQGNGNWRTTTRNMNSLSGGMRLNGTFGQRAPARRGSGRHLWLSSASPFELTHYPTLASSPVCRSGVRG
jgi:hypothetical protein